MGAELGKIYAVWLREVKRFWNSKARVFGSLGMPLLFLLALGGGIGALVPGFNYQSFILPGIIGMTILFNAMFSGVSIIWDRELGYLKAVLVAPTSRLNIVIGRTLGGATTSAIQGAMILAIGSLLGMVHPALTSLPLILIAMVMFASLIVAVGIIFASVIQEVETFQLIMNLLIMPLFFLSNALFPLERMPDWLRTLSSFNPVSYAVDGFRDLILGQGSYSLGMDLAVMAVALGLALGIASYFFNKTNI